MGTKEFVASTAQYLRLRSPDRDTVLYPAVSYPTYAMGALLAGCRPVPVPELPGGGPDLSAVDEADAGAGPHGVDQLAVQSDRLPDRPGAAAEWARDRGIPLFSDECYAEFTWDGPPRSVLECGTDGVIAVHSLSKRSNLAGVRAGFYAGDPDLVAYPRRGTPPCGVDGPRPRAGGAVVALDDDAHVVDQRRRYLERLTLSGRGARPRRPARRLCRPGGFYLWVPVPTSASPGGRVVGHRGPGPRVRDAGQPRASSTDPAGLASCGWPRSSPWNDSSWWPTLAGRDLTGSVRRVAATGSERWRTGRPGRRSSVAQG